MYLLEYTLEKDEDPDAVAVTFFEFVRKWKPMRAGVESIAYQRTLKWFLEREMKKKRIFVQIEAIVDQRDKRKRIVQGLSGRASSGCLYVHKRHVEFIADFGMYPQVRHDDLLDAVSMGPLLLNAYSDGAIEGEYEEVDESGYDELPDWRTC